MPRGCSPLWRGKGVRGTAWATRSRNATPLLPRISQVIHNGREVLKGFVVKVLNDVKAHIPEDAGYRKVVEATYQHRLDIIEAGSHYLPPPGGC